MYVIHGPSVFSILGKLPIGPRGTCVQVRVVGMTQQLLFARGLQLARCSAGDSMPMVILLSWHRAGMLVTPEHCHELVTLADAPPWVNVNESTIL